MTIDLSRVQRLSQVLAEKRFEVTGHLLHPPEASGWSPQIDDAAAFKELVSSMYVEFHERWGDEIHYITEAVQRLGAETADAREFGGLLVDLRTMQQHNPNPTSVRRCERWFRDVVGTDSPRSADDWTRCAEQFVGQCVRALSSLVGAVNAIRADGAASADWQSRASAAAAVDPDAKLGVVLGDLGLAVTPGQRTHLGLQVDHDWSRRLAALGPSDDVDEELAKTVARVVVGWALSPLPCAYSDILDAVGMSPGPEAVGVIELAHALADLREFDDDVEFLELVVRAWGAVEGL